MYHNLSLKLISKIFEEKKEKQGSSECNDMGQNTVGSEVALRHAVDEIYLIIKRKRAPAWSWSNESLEQEQRSFNN